MLQSVNHIFASRIVKIGQIWIKIGLLEQAHQMQSFNTMLAEFH